MSLIFERGEERQPKGHALVYFRGAEDSSQILASYLLVLPIPLNVTKYLPPLFAAQAAHFPSTGIAAFPFPPLPEVVESYRELQSLAELRDDDLVFGGTLNPQDVESGLQITNEIMQQYQSLYMRYRESLPKPAEEEPAGASVDEVLFSLSNEKDKLTEISKLVGKIRFGVSSNDTAMVKEAIAEIEALGKYLPAGYKLSSVIKAAQVPGPRGDKLSELYLSRCYKICDEDYVDLGKIEEQIRQLEPQSS